MTYKKKDQGDDTGTDDTGTDDTSGADASASAPTAPDISLAGSASIIASGILANPRTSDTADVARDAVAIARAVLAATQQGA